MSAMATATNSPTFPLFSSLALELRNQIWRDALPEKIAPALFFYKKGCWHLTDSDTEHDPSTGDPMLEFHFRYDLLDKVQFEIPLYFVNREARNVALAWIREQGSSIKIRHQEDGQNTFLVQSFDIFRDVLYIPQEQWYEFLCEPLLRLSEPDLIGRLVGTTEAFIRVALPEKLLRTEIGKLGFSDMIPGCYWEQALFVIADAKPDLRSEDNDLRVQRRWELENTQGGKFVWNADRRRFDFEDGEDRGDEELYGLIREVNKELREALIDQHARSLEVRPVFAVRR